MKKIFSLKLTIYLCLFYSLLTTLLPAETYKFGIKNFCEQVSIKDLLIDKIKINHIEIQINNTRKWNKNILRAVVRNDPKLSRIDIIEKDRKKKFKANLILNYSDNKNCTFKSRIRIHGDLGDHIELDDGLPITSMHVRLLEGNVNNVVKFKLFLPRTRSYMNEIFIATFFKHLNFLSPRTSIVKVKINGKFHNYIFQEHIAKELLENNNFVEGPILEVHEDFEHQLGNEAKRLARISNFKWANKGKDELNSSIMAVSNLNNIFLMSNFYKLNNTELNNIEDLIINPNISLNHYDKIKKKYLAFEALMYVLEAAHGLSYDDRRFYYDHIYSSFLPIYYDGSSTLFSPNSKYVPPSYTFDKSSINTLNKEYIRKFEKVLISTKISARIALGLVEKIDVIKLKEELNKSGFNINLKDLNATLKLIKERLEKIEFLRDYKIEPANFKQPYYSFFEYEKKVNIIFYNQEEEKLYRCPANSINIKQCVPEFFSNLNEKIPLFLNQENLNMQTQENIFISKNIKNYFSNKFDEEQNITAWKRFNLDEVNLVSYGNIDVKIDRENRRIILQANESSSRIVFFDGILQEWKIEFNGGLSNLEYIRKVKGLTGCITFLDVEVTDIDLDLKNAKCEDSVNFIRSKGTIENLIIHNSLSDALDADFSDLYIKNIMIEKAKNDCLDFSFGKYKIKYAKIHDCGDKGISFGEKSVGKINEVEIKNSSIGVASKDSSIVEINKISNKQSNVCLAAYRKKQEFYGSIILFNEMRCDASVAIYAEPGSNIENVYLNEF